MRYWILKNLTRLLVYGLYSFRVINREHLPEEGPLLIAANHDSFLDPPVVGIAFRGRIQYLARKSLMTNAFVRWVYAGLNVTPVDQEKPDLVGMRTIVRLLKEGNRVLVFPEGARSWDGKLQPGQPGVGLLVAKTKAPVLPIRMFGCHEALPRGGRMLRPSRITLVVGEPIDFSKEPRQGRGKEAYQAISDRIMEAIGELELPGGGGGEAAG